MSSGVYGIGSGLTASYTGSSANLDADLSDTVEDFLQGDIVLNVTKTGMENLLGGTATLGGTPSVTVDNDVLKHYLSKALNGISDDGDLAEAHGTHPLQDFAIVFDELRSALQTEGKNEIAARIAGYSDNAAAVTAGADLTPLINALESNTLNLFGSFNTKIDGLGFDVSSGDITVTGTSTNFFPILADADVIDQSGTIDIGATDGFGINISLNVDFSLESTLTFSSDTLGNGGANARPGSLAGTFVTVSKNLSDASDASIAASGSSSSRTYTVTINYPG
jgi:hypothetical protein